MTFFFLFYAVYSLKENAQICLFSMKCEANICTMNKSPCSQMSVFISPLDVPFITESSVCFSAAEPFQRVHVLLFAQILYWREPQERETSSFNSLLNFEDVNTVPAVQTFLKSVHNLVGAACFQNFCAVFLKGTLSGCLL